MNNYWTAFRHDNGMALTVASIIGGVWRRLHNRFVFSVLPGAPGVRIHPSAFVRGQRYIYIGKNFIAGRNLWMEAITTNQGTKFTPNITIGNDVIVNENVHIGACERITIGNDVLVASRVYISDHNHGIYGRGGHSSPDVPARMRPLTRGQPVVIGDRAWIGEMVSILPGVSIGTGSIIGAGSVVTHDIPPNSIAVGAPARVIKRFDPETEMWMPV